MDSLQLTENFCEAIKIITEDALSGIKYDKTVVATITDISKRKQGIYTVSDGSIQFIAYSDVLNYSVGTNVYITIPEGDYSNDKIILGKKLKDDVNQSFIYHSPFNNIADVSGNLCNTNDQFSLLANNPNVVIKEICDINFLADGGIGYSGFSYLGIKAGFRAWLKTVNCISGNYGLKITFTCRPAESNDGTKQPDYTKEAFLTIDDMIGDPYAFETFFTQEKVVDISSLGTIIRLKIEFFQEAGTFKDMDNNLISYLEEPIDGLDLKIPLQDNLFVNNVFVCLGLDMQNYNDDFVQIFTFDNGTYSQSVQKEKKVSLKWIHIEDEVKHQMNSASKEEFEIRWYRNNKNGKADQFSGYGWELLDFNATKLFDISFMPDGETKEQEQIKAIVLLGKAPEYKETSITNTEFQLNYFNYFYKDENNNFINFSEDDEFIPNGELIDDKFQSMNCYSLESDNRKVYTSNILYFINQNDVRNYASIDALRALSLIPKEYSYSETRDEENNVISSQKIKITTQGNYFLYSETGELMNKAQADMIRLLECKFDLSSEDGENTATLQNAEKIIWEYPLNNTMIIPAFEDGRQITNEDDDSVPVGYGQLIYEQQIDEDGKVILNEVQDHYLKNKAIQFPFKINQFYNSSRENNLIKCSIIKDGLLYSATKDLQFGQSGTSGTAFTFRLNFEDGINCLTLKDLQGNHLGGKSESEVEVKAYLYDQDGQSIDISDQEINWSWFKATGDNIIIVDKNKKDSRLLSFKSSLEIDELYILQAKLPKWRKTSNENEQDAYDLVAYLPIPIRENSNYLYFNGPDKISYLTDGYPVYYKGYFDLVTVEGYVKDYSHKWESIVTVSNDKEKDYLPEIIHDYQEKLNSETNTTEIIDRGYYLSAPSMFIDKLPVFGVCYKSKITESSQETIKWTQPILIHQSLYPCAFVNQWDGKGVDISETEGTILSNILGAGSKNSQNQFSGVLLGDLRKKSQSDLGQSVLETQTGLFGFNNGEMSFSFTNDGIARIGKATKGQIIFNGDKGLIASKTYIDSMDKTTIYGMGIDLDDSFIKMYSPQGASKTGSISINAKATTYPFEIKNNSQGNYFKVDWDGSLSCNNVNINGILNGNCKISVNGNTDKTLSGLLTDIQNTANSALSLATIKQTADDAYGMAYTLKTITENGSALWSPNNTAKLWAANNGSCGCNGHFSIGGGLNIGANLVVKGMIYPEGGIYNYSDIRIKENINYNLEPLKDLFFKLMPFSYNLLGKQEKQLGFSAQQLDLLIENLEEKDKVNFACLVQKNESTYKGIKDLKALNYNNFIGLNTYMIQEAYKEINELKKEIQELKGRINND